MSVVFDYKCEEHGIFEFTKASIHDETPEVTCPKCKKICNQFFGNSANISVEWQSVRQGSQ